MIWQDFVLGAAFIVIAYALVPQVIQNHKTKKRSINLKTAIMTTVCLYLICVLYLTLNLYFSFVVTFITASLWFILLIQSIKYKN